MIAVNIITPDNEKFGFWNFTAAAKWLAEKNGKTQVANYAKMLRRRTPIDGYKIQYQE